MRSYGLLIISHGSRDTEWVRLVREAVTAVKLPKDIEDAPMECSFLELVKGCLIQDGIDRLERHGVTDIIAIPLFVSSGSTHIDEIGWALGTKDQPELETDLERFQVQANVHLCSPIDDDPEIAELLAEKLRPISEAPEREIVLIVGHGSKEKGFHARWRRGLVSLARQVQAIGGFAETDTAMLLPDQTVCKMKVWRERRPELDILIAPLFLSEGYFTNQVIPSRMEGFRYRYAGAALLPSPYITRWMERRIASKLDSITADVSGQE